MRSRTCIFDSRTWTERQHLALMRRMAVHGFSVGLECRGGANGAEFAWHGLLLTRGEYMSYPAPSAWGALCGVAAWAEKERIAKHEHKASA